MGLVLLMHLCPFYNAAGIIVLISLAVKKGTGTNAVLKQYMHAYQDKQQRQETSHFLSSKGRS